MKNLALRFKNIDNLKPTTVKLPQETIDYLDHQTGKPPYEYIKVYLKDNKLYKSISEKYIDYVNKTLPKKTKDSCQYCNGDSKDENNKKCNNYHNEAQMNFYFASFEFVSVVERNKHLIKDNTLRKKLTLQFYECFAFSNGRVIFDLEKMAMLCLKAGFLSLSRVFANNSNLQNLSIINSTINELNDEELNAEMFNKEKSIYLEPQKTFFKNKYEHYERKHFIEKEKNVTKTSKNKKENTNNTSRPNRTDIAYYTHYMSETKLLKLNNPFPSDKGWKEIGEKFGKNSKNIQQTYNQIHYNREERLKKSKIGNLKYVINQMLVKDELALKLAKDELKSAQLNS